MSFPILMAGGMMARMSSLNVSIMVEDIGSGFIHGWDGTDAGIRWMTTPTLKGFTFNNISNGFPGFDDFEFDVDDVSETCGEQVVYRVTIETGINSSEGNGGFRSYNIPYIISPSHGYIFDHEFSSTRWFFGFGTDLVWDADDIGTWKHVRFQYGDDNTA